MRTWWRLVDHNNGEVVGGANHHASRHRGEYSEDGGDGGDDETMGEADHGHDGDGDREM